MYAIVADSASQLWWFRTVFFEVKRSWRSEERCTAVLFGSVLVMALYAPYCHRDLDVFFFETFIKDVSEVLWEVRRAGAKSFHIAGDLNVELGLLCTSDEDVEEPNEMYVP